MILQDSTGFEQEHKAKIQQLKNRIGSLQGLSSEALLVISRIAYQLKENQHPISQENILEILSFCGLRLEYITNVLLKNRIYRLRQDPEVEDVGLKSICFAHKHDGEDSQASTHYNDTKSASKQVHAEEAKHQQVERTKQKELHKSIIL